MTTGAFFPVCLIATQSLARMVTSIPAGGAGICAKDIKRFDATAYQREVLRRLVMGGNGKEKAA